MSTSYSLIGLILLQICQASKNYPPPLSGPNDLSNADYGPAVVASPLFRLAADSSGSQKPRILLTTTAAIDVCPTYCECDTPGVVSCVGQTLEKLPERLPPETRYFYSEHNVFAYPMLSSRNFTFFEVRRLVAMSLHNCSITTVNYMTFQPLSSSLQELDLSNNRIAILEDGAFSGLNLNMLDLSGNYRIQFSKFAFKGCTIRRLALRSIGLKNFDLATFSFVLPNLVSLSLADNALGTLDYRLFSACAPLLSTVYLARNPWNCGGPNKARSNVGLSGGGDLPIVAPLTRPTRATKPPLVSPTASTGSSCTPTQLLIAYVEERQTVDLIVDEPPTCYRGDPGNASGSIATSCKKRIQDLVNSTKCPVNIGGKKIGDADTDSDRQPRSHQQDLGGTTSKQPKFEKTNVLQTEACYKISSVVTAATIGCIATLIVILAACLCGRACYLRYCKTGRNALHDQNCGGNGGSPNNSSANWMRGGSSHRQPQQLLLPPSSGSQAKKEAMMNKPSNGSNGNGNHGGAQAVPRQAPPPRMLPMTPVMARPTTPKQSGLLSSEDQLAAGSSGSGIGIGSGESSSSPLLPSNHHHHYHNGQAHKTNNNNNLPKSNHRIGHPVTTDQNTNHRPEFVGVRLSGGPQPSPLVVN